MPREHTARMPTRADPTTRFARSTAAETWRRVGFTVGALLLYRVGAPIPLPGVDLSVLALLQPSRGTWREWLDIGLSSYPGRLSIFALGLTPYLLVWSLAELAIGLVPALAAFQRQGPAARRALNQWVRI